MVLVTKQQIWSVLGFCRVHKSAFRATEWSWCSQERPSWEWRMLGNDLCVSCGQWLQTASCLCPILQRRASISTSHRCLQASRESGKSQGWRTRRVWNFCHSLRCLQPVGFHLDFHWRSALDGKGPGLSAVYFNYLLVNNSAKENLIRVKQGEHHRFSTMFSLFPPSGAQSSSWCFTISVTGTEVSAHLSWYVCPQNTRRPEI